jgi:hypothetical protein
MSWKVWKPQCSGNNYGIVAGEEQDQNLPMVTLERRRNTQAMRAQSVSLEGKPGQPSMIAKVVPHPYLA